VFPGYSWSLTHHAIANAEKNLYGLLAAAYHHMNRADPGRSINEELVGTDVLTANVRADRGRPDAWRDYQQALAELGLIVSTRLTLGRVLVTPMGMLYLDRALKHRELLTTQALRYQYPNGQKLDVSPRVANEMLRAGLSVPRTLVEAQVDAGVLVKPAVLLLRVLLALKAMDSDPVITVDECQRALVPVTRNADWHRGLEQVLSLRQGQDSTQTVGDRRNVQDWFTFLGLTDLFVKDGDNLRLSYTAQSGLTVVESLCSVHEEPSSFWVPTAFSRQELLRGWFTWFGGCSAWSQWTARDTHEHAEGGDDEGDAGDDDTSVAVTGPAAGTINLEPLPDRAACPLFGQGGTALVDLGPSIHRREKATLLHAEVVSDLAGLARSKGFQTFDDSRSVDLFIRRGAVEALFEVKTVTARSLQHQLRLAIGQVSEYCYRHFLQSGREPLGLVVVTTDLRPEDWRREFLGSYMGYGLVGWGNRGFECYSSCENDDIGTIFAQPA
jgi:hypothetical protein